MFVYHRVPEALSGKYLCPLNELRSLLPEVYAREVQKYEGREGVLSQRVSNLNCLWNDVLHFSPLHPRLVGEALVRAGFSHQPRKWFAVDPVRHGFTKSNSSLYLHLPHAASEQAEDFVDFLPAQLAQFQALPEATVQYYLECKSKGVRPLLFAWVPHVLFRGRLEIAALETIEA